MKQESPAEIWTTKRLLAWMRERFETEAIDSPRVVAEMLLSHVLRCERLRLYMEIDRPASAAELASLRDLVRRALLYEPVQYLVGQGWFYGRPFEVDRSTLIPRPSTETLIDAVIVMTQDNRAGSVPVDPALTGGTGQEGGAQSKRNTVPAANCETTSKVSIADIGTGTGCIAITLALQIPAASVIATDIRPDAIILAERNAVRHRVCDRVEFRAGDLYMPLRGEVFDIICSNPPYVPDHEWGAVERNVKDHEPESALRAGPDGLDVIRRLIGGAAEHLRSGGRLIVEIADCQSDEVRKLIESSSGLRFLKILKDHEHLWRVAVAERI